MTKQEEIKDRLWNILPCPNDSGSCVLEDCDTCADRITMVDNVLTNLHSQGVVIKVERELGRSLKRDDLGKDTIGELVYQSREHGYSLAELDMANAGCDFFEPLVEK